MRRHYVAVILSAVLAFLPALAGCGSDSSSSQATPEATTEVESQESDFDAIATYWGQWRGSVKVSGDSPYGTTSGFEQMLDVYLNTDGTCSIEPLESHADLLSDEGTWEGTETEIVLHLTSGDITITPSSETSLEADAAAFGVEGFDTLEFALY